MVHRRENAGHAPSAKVENGTPPTEPRGPVLFVAPEPFYEDRGTPIAVRQVLAALSERGVEVDLLTYPVGSAIDLPGLRVFRVANPFGFRGVPIGLSFRKVILDLLLGAEIPKLLRKRRYACIHAVEESAFLAVLAARRRGVPVIYDMQSSLPEQLGRGALWRGPTQAILRFFERWLLRRVDLVACSAGLGALVASAAPETPVVEWIFPGQRLDVDPGVVEDLRGSLGIQPGAPVILYCGTFEPYQGLSYLIDAAPDVRREVPQATFLLVGGRANRSSGVEKNGNGVLRIPRQPRGRLPAFLALADVVVSPRAYGNNLPLKIFDYMAAGKPIVATDSPVHRTVLNDRVALLVEPSPRGIARGVIDLLIDPARATCLGEAARAYAEEDLGWTSFVHRVWETYAAGSSARRNGGA